jgi:hypothetical protein
MVYVDDLVLIGDLESVQSMKKKLNIHFEMSDFGPLSCFLAIAVPQDENGLHLSLEQYAEEILPRFQFSCSHPCSTSLSPGTKFRQDSGALLSQYDATLYRSISGLIIYLMLATMPDLSYAVGAVSQFSSAPSVNHLAALHHMLMNIPTSAHPMIPPVRGWTGPDWTTRGLVQSSPRSFWTGIGPVPNSVGPGLDWTGLV